MTPFSAKHPCPVCGGHKAMPQGQGRRCYGFLSEDGLYAHCTRDEQAGGLAKHPKTDAYAHRLGVDCKCGKSHQASTAPLTKAKDPTKPWWTPVAMVPADAPNPTFRHRDHPKGHSAVYAYRNNEGHLVGYRVRFEGEGGAKDILPYTWCEDTNPDTARPPRWHWRDHPVPRPIYGAQDLAAKPGAIVLLVEGEGKRDKAAELYPQFAVISASGGAGGPRFADFTALINRNVVVWRDNDDEGSKMVAFAEAPLRMAGAAAYRCVELPDGLPPKWDLGDPFPAWLSVDDARQLIEEAPVWKAKGLSSDGVDDTRPEILITAEERAVNDQAIGALSKSSLLYQRGGMLVHIVAEEAPPPDSKRPPGTPAIKPIMQANLREQMADTAVWKRPRPNGGDTRSHPPDWSVRAVHGRGTWPGIRHLEGFVEAPFIRPDGTVCATPGYDPATGLQLRTTCRFPAIPSSPTLADAQAALEVLKEPFQDFPFAGEAYRSGAIAGVLTMFARSAFYGPVPMFLIDGNVRGAGKGKAVHAISLIYSGRVASTQDQPTEPEEERKLITAIAMDGDPMVLIDNIARTLGSSALDAALTSTSWSDRILGVSERPKLPLRTVWFGTGNNVQFRGDMVRRVVHIRLESQDQNPERRRNFRHPDLLGWVTENRGKLAAAAVTILRAWFVAGCPDMDLEPWGSYEAWSRVVRNALVWVGMPDPGDTRSDLEAVADPEIHALGVLLEGWEELVNEKGVDVGGGRKGVTTATALSILGDQLHVDQFDQLRAALAELAPKSTPRSLAQKLTKFRGRVVGGRKFDRVEGKNGAFWLVVNAGLSQSPAGERLSNSLTTKSGEAHSQQIAENGSSPQNSSEASGVRGVSQKPLTTTLTTSGNGHATEDTDPSGVRGVSIPLYTGVIAHSNASNSPKGESLTPLTPSNAENGAQTGNGSGVSSETQETPSDRWAVEL